MKANFANAIFSEEGKEQRFLNGSRAGGRERSFHRTQHKMSIVPPLRINEIDYN